MGRAGAWLGAMNLKGLPDGGGEGKQRGSRGSLAAAEVGVQDRHGFFILPGGSGSLALG